MKYVFVITIGILFEIIISATIPLHNHLLTYFLIVVLYGLAGLFAHEKKHNHVLKVFMLLPMVIIKLFAVWVNAANYPFLFPVAFILTLLSYTLGYQTKQMKLITTFVFYTVFVCMLCTLSLVVIPQIKYEKSLKPISLKNKNITTWHLTNLEGNPYPFARVKGKVVLLNFTWHNCPPCIKKHPFLEELQQKYLGNNNVEIFEVYIGEYGTLAQATNFAKKSEASFQWLYDPENQLARQLQFEGAPHEVLLDKQGNVCHIGAGFSQDVSLIYINEITKKIDKALMAHK